ncbi:hypothetical protein [Hominimerdicola sp. 21CYCFAH17_S]
MIRYTEACSIAEKIKLPVADIIIDITYDGKYIPTENNGNKVFNKIENAELSDKIVQSFTECGLVKSMITIDMDRDLYKYQASSRQSSEDIILPLSEAVRISRTKTEELDRKSEVWSICELSDILKPEFKALRQKYKISDRFSDYERAAAVFHPFSEPEITITPTRHGRS